MSSYRALVVDFGGVLTSSLEDAMAAFAIAHGIEMQHLVRAALSAYMGSEDALVTDFETGRMSEEHFAVAFAHRLSEYSGVDIAHGGLVDRLFEALELEEDMFELVERARARGFKTALLSNSWGLGLYPLARINDLFDVVVISGEVGLRKPDPAIFKLTIDRLDLKPEDCVFVDDHPGHLKAAQGAGMTTVLHKFPGQSIPEVEALLELA
ncbi:MAG: HAD family hydrolase [Actinomycetota bacterium]